MLASALQKLGAIFALLVTVVAGLSCTRGFVPTAQPLRQADVIVVLGNRPPTDAEGNVMPETRRRVTAGVELFHAGLAEGMLMAGGPAPHDRVESEVMRDLAVELGVPAEVIRIERRSRNTIENARNTLEILCDGAAPCYPSIILVSSPYHLRRARYLFECAGARVQTAASEDPGGSYGRRFVFSEHMVAFAYGFVDECRDANPAPRTPPPSGAP
ncbi:MAG: YdcF family protein [Polyangiales bacterium]